MVDDVLIWRAGREQPCGQQPVTVSDCHCIFTASILHMVDRVIEAMEKATSSQT